MKKAPIDWTDAEAEQVIQSLLTVMFSDVRKPAETDIRNLIAWASCARAEGDALDAARYRWLADSFTGNAVDVHELTLDADEMTRAQFDAAVDAERSGMNHGEGKK